MMGIDTKSNSTSSRIEYIDVVKALAIFFVIWGHIIQCNDAHFWENGIFAFIYSFHMPLFFMLSGMFLSKFFSLSFGEALRKRAIQLLLPACVVSLVSYIIYIVFGLKAISLHNIAVAFATIPWFCVSLFCCNIIAYVAMKCCKSDVVACLASVALLYLIPNVDFYYVRPFLPFLWSGYFLMKYKEYLYEHIRWLLPLVLVTFIVLSFFWTSQYTVYNTTSTLWTVSVSQMSAFFRPEALTVGIYRFIMGCTGSLSIILLVKAIYDRAGNKPVPFLAYIGSSTLGIYLLQTFGEKFFFRMLSPVYQSFTPPLREVAEILLPPIAAAIVVILLTVIIYWMRKNRYLSLLFLGNDKAFLCK